MTSTTSSAREKTTGIYFFLSYAHSPPISDDVNVDPDHWVKVFFAELKARVKQLAKPNSDLEIGFADYEVQPSSDWKAQLSRALGAAEVFVPLYSPRYLAMPWPLSERASFEQRLRAAPAAATGHVQPVLWIPVPSSSQSGEVVDALRLGVNTPSYAENGLRTLRMHNDLRRDYRAVLDRLARDIVRVAEQSPLGPSHAPEPSGTVRPGRTTTPFVVAVLAPTDHRPAPERDPAPYGATARAWRPFRGAQARPIADYAANVAERLGLPSRTVDFDRVRDAFVASPGVLIIDPWIVATQPWSTTLADVAAALPEWVTPLIIVDKHDPQYESRGNALMEQALSMLPYTGIPRERVRRQAPVADDVEEFVRLMPMIVAQTRRKFLRHHPAAGARDASPRRPWSESAGTTPVPDPKEDR